MATPHGKVRVKRPGDDKARTVPAALWQIEDKLNPFKKQGYVLVSDPVGITASGETQTKRRKKQQEPEEEQPETNVEEL